MKQLFRKKRRLLQAIGLLVLILTLRAWWLHYWIWAIVGQAVIFVISLAVHKTTPDKERNHPGEH